VSRRVVVGEVLGAFGIRGWIKVQSHTDPPENILRYSPWFIGEAEAPEAFRVVAGRSHGYVVVAGLEGITDRDRAAFLGRKTISVERDQFPELPPDEFYWADLVGLEVRTTGGVVLGKVTGMIETGANDVLEVRGDRERLIPFVRGDFVKDVRLNEGVLIVDWDPDF
jgi:16S rRNA processing protein RimM